MEKEKVIAFFDLGRPGKNLNPEIGINSTFKVYVYPSRVEIVEHNPGLLSPVVLTLEGNNVKVNDWWGWAI